MVTSLSSDSRKILLAQGLRGFAYGFGAVLLGTSLATRGFSPNEVGLLIGSVVAGTVLAQLGVARWADRWGRRRTYVLLYVLLALVGVVFSTSSPLWALILAALTGALSTEVVESGPFTSIEQSMLARNLQGHDLTKGFGLYNAIAAAAGSIGALAAGLPQVINQAVPGVPSDQRLFIVLALAAVVGAVVAGSLSSQVEAGAIAHRGNSQPPRSSSIGLGESRSTVLRLAGLFGLDSFGGGFVVQAFIAYWLAARFNASTALVGGVFFAVGLVQTGSFLVAPLLARRFGLLNTMVFTHLPSNILLGAVAFAPNIGVAVGLLVGRTALSQMDVPTRQAYVMALVRPEERTAAAAYTNTARYIVRPLGPTLAGAFQALAVGLPFLLAGAIKAAYDLILWRWFKDISLNNTIDGDPNAAPLTAEEEER